MRLFFIGFSFLLFSVSFKADTFKSEQLKYPRVRKAYADKGADMNKLLNENLLKEEQLRLYLRAFKEEKKIELWAKNKSDEKYKLVKSYKICRSSGKVGPKRKQGDLQVPEGFYHINIFNPHSNFYLSLGLNYPNKSDRILGKKGNLGGDIYVHGDCVTIGCLPITDEQIKELYILCIEAKNCGQEKIPVTIFPTELTEKNLSVLIAKYDDDTDRINLWNDLQKGYQQFNDTKQLPSISFLQNGRHQIN